MLEELLRSRWFVKIIAFLLALLLFLGITIDAPPHQPNNNPFLSFFTTKQEPSFVEVELVSYYDEEKYVVTGLPERVSVFLEGSESLITKAKLTNYEVYVDLREYNIGTHQVEVKHRNLPGQLTVKTDPEVVTITIQEKVSKLIPVDVQVINDSKLPIGYVHEDPVVYPNSVRVTGAKSQINKIALIKGYVNIAFAKKDIETSVPLFIYDNQGNELKGFDVYPAVIDVSVAITSPKKVVPIRVDKIINLPQGLSIASITLEPSTVNIYGQLDDINQYEYLNGLLDLANIKRSTELMIDVRVPEDITKVYPEKVKAKVQVAKQEMKSFIDVNIKVKGLEQGLEASFLTPAEGMFNIDLLGAESVLPNVTLSDFNTYVDLSDLGVGEHFVNIELEYNGPHFVSWQLETIIAKIKITE